MYTAVFSDLTKLRYNREIMILPMLKYKPSVIFQKVPAENKKGYLVKLLQVIGRVGKDNIIVAGCMFQVPESICTDDRYLVKLKVGDCLLDK